VILLLGLSSGLVSFGQNSEIGNWLFYAGNQKFQTRYNFWNEIQYRNYNLAGDLQQLLLRGGIGYDLTDNNNNVLLGYGFILSENYTSADEKVSSKEHRVYGQFLTKQRSGICALTHRYRFEQRFINDDVRYRFRYFLALNIPLNKKELVARTIYFSAYNEVFLNNEVQFFDRNRLYGGIGYFLNDQVKLELGFMNQFVNGLGRNQFQITLFNNLPF
jgi:hypothetical protein